MQLNPYLQLIGTFWPILGLALVVIFSLVTRGTLRWLVLFIGPLVAIAPAWIFVGEIAYDGNMLFVIILILSVLTLFVYYPALIIAGIIFFWRSRRTTP